VPSSTPHKSHFLCVFSMFSDVSKSNRSGAETNRNGRFQYYFLDGNTGGAQIQ
jgi:hypothetical protein